MLEEQKVVPGVLKADLGSDGVEKPFSGPPRAAEPELKVEHITARWSDESSHPTLRDLSFAVKAGQLVAVVGPVGCGKVLNQQDYEYIIYY
jgi:ABC-type multidrug transport system fused ATPase/permease subunit